MSPDLTRELVIDLRAWYEESDVSQKNLARKLYLTPQQLSEIFAGRNRPTGEQVLRIQEFLQTNNMKTDLIDPRTKPRPNASNPGQPKTLQEAKEMIEGLRAQIKGGGAPSPASVPVLPKAKAQTPAGGDPTTTPVAERLSPTPMPASPAPPKKALPPEANTPVLIQRILDVTTLEDLRSMLDNPVHTLTQQSCLYTEIRKRRDLVANRFQ